MERVRLAAEIWQKRRQKYFKVATNERYHITRGSTRAVLYRRSCTKPPHPPYRPASIPSPRRTRSIRARRTRKQCGASRSQSREVPTHPPPRRQMTHKSYRSRLPTHTRTTPRSRRRHPSPRTPTRAAPGANEAARPRRRRPSRRTSQPAEQTSARPTTAPGHRTNQWRRRSDHAARVIYT